MRLWKRRVLVLAVLPFSLCVMAHAAQIQPKQEISGIGQAMPALPESVVIKAGAIATDVAATDWYFNAVVTMVDAKIMDTAAGKFLPQDTMTREQIAIALYLDAKSMGLSHNAGDKAAKEAPDGETISADAREAVSFCVNAQIMMGDAAGNLFPQNLVTREEMATMLKRYCAYTKLGKESQEGMALREFTDEDKISRWAHNGILFCVQNGIMRGNADGSFNPAGQVTRAECAQIITNLLTLIPSQSR